MDFLIPSHWYSEAQLVEQGLISINELDFLIGGIFGSDQHIHLNGQRVNGLVSWQLGVVKLDVAHCAGTNLWTNFNDGVEVPMDACQHVLIFPLLYLRSDVPEWPRVHGKYAHRPDHCQHWHNCYYASCQFGVGHVVREDEINRQDEAHHQHYPTYYFAVTGLVSYLVHSFMFNQYTIQFRLCFSQIILFIFKFENHSCCPSIGLCLACS